MAAPVVEEAPVAEDTPVVEDTPVEKTPVAEIADSSLEGFEIEMKPLRTPVDENQLTIDFVPSAEPAAPEKKAEAAPAEKKNIEKEKQKAQKRVRSMFDLITFDNV